MNADRHTDRKLPAAKPIASIAVLGARITWTLLGPTALFFVTAAIVLLGTGWLTRLDLAFAVFAGLVLFGRWFEHRSGSATTMNGEPETQRDYQRYMIAFPIVAAIVWIAANVVGNHLFAGSEIA